MTPEEHIERAEWLLALTDKHGTSVKPVTVQAAEVHVRIAEYKQRFPPEAGRPLPRPLSADKIRSVVPHSHAFGDVCDTDCPAHKGS